MSWFFGIYWPVVWALPYRGTQTTAFELELTCLTILTITGIYVSN